MPLESVALIPACAECEAVWLPADEARWQAWLTDDEPPELVFYSSSVLSGSSAATEGRLVKANAVLISSFARFAPLGVMAKKDGSDGPWT